MPLHESEEALPLQAPTGVSGMALGDMPAVDAEGRDIYTTTLARFVGRTWPSPCASHDTELIYWNDNGTYPAKFKEVTPSKIREFEPLDDKERLLATFRAARHKLFDGRPMPAGIDGVIEAYCPPYYPDMAAVVDAVVEAKLGPGGPFNLETQSPSPYLDRNEFATAVP